MKNKLLIAVTFACTLTLFIGVIGCKKSVDSEDTGIGKDHATLEKTFNDVQSISDQAGTSGSVSSFRSGEPTILGGCATVTNDTISVPHVLTIDFGTANCTGVDGNLRRGKIIVTYSGHYSDAGSYHTITFNNYFVNDNQVTGTKTVTNMGLDANGHTYWTVAVNGSIILGNNAGTISWTANRTRTWIAGQNTTIWSDDQYQISGSGTVTRANGNKFDINITSPLLVTLDCHWVRQGTVQITPQGSTARTLDYGNGACDAMATYTVNGKVYNISLN